MSLSHCTLHACIHWYILDTRTPIRTQTHMFTLHLASSNSMWLYELTMFSNLISGRIVIIQTVDTYFLLISQVTARALWWIGHDWTLGHSSWWGANMCKQSPQTLDACVSNNIRFLDCPHRSPKSTRPRPARILGSRQKGLRLQQRLKPFRAKHTLQQGPFPPVSII